MPALATGVLQPFAAAWHLAVRLAWIGKAWAPLLAYLVTIVAAP